MIEVDRYFDIETSDWTNFAVGGVIDAGTEEFWYTTNEEELFWNLLSPGKGTVWSWNGGKFDMLWLLDMAKKLYGKGPIDTTCRIGTQGSRVSSVRINGVHFRDSVTVCPFSLAKAAPIAGLELSKDTGLDCICIDNCGGYCAITPGLEGLSEKEKADLIEYLRLDCLAGLKIMEALIAEAERCDYQLTGTIGGSSWKTAKETLGLDPSNWDASEYKASREAYFGGRVEVFQPVSSEGFSYDINSAYPAALVSTELPVGERMQCDKEKARRAFEREREGLYLARCIVPEMFIPPLPVRLMSGRVAFPIGEVRGRWTASELREAIRLGCDVDIRGGIVWADKAPVFREYMGMVWKNRNRYGPEGEEPNPAFRLWHKFFANSLTGKLAEKPDKERVVMFPDEEKIVYCDGRPCQKSCEARDAWKSCSVRSCCSKAHRSTCGAWRQLDLDGDFYTAPFFRISECAHVQWAAYLTATARIQLGRQLRADGEGGMSALYCDTDSVYATKERHEDIGPELGQWGSDGSISDWMAVAPKLYRYTDENGRKIVKAKGLSNITPEQFEAFTRGEPVTNTRGVKSFKTAVRDESGSLFLRNHLTRSNRGDGIHYGSRVLSGDGKTYPRTIDDLIRWEEASKRRKANQ